MSWVLRLLAFAVAAGVLYPLVKNYEPQLAPLLAVAVSAGLVWLFLTAGTEVFKWLEQIGAAADGQAFACLVKAAGILVCADWCRDLCCDSGLTAAGGCIQLAGRCMALAAAFPLLKELSGLVLGFVV